MRDNSYNTYLFLTCTQRWCLILQNNCHHHVDHPVLSFLEKIIKNKTMTSKLNAWLTKLETWWAKITGTTALTSTEHTETPDITASCPRTRPPRRSSIMKTNIRSSPVKITNITNITNVNFRTCMLFLPWPMICTLQYYCDYQSHLLLCCQHGWCWVLVSFCCLLLTLASV